MKRLVLIGTLLLSFAVHAELANNLAVICKGTAANPPAAGTACSPHKYDRPLPTSIVHSGGGWKVFSTLADTTTMEVCSQSITVGADSDPSSGLPCTNWVYIAKSAVPIPPVIVVPPPPPIVNKVGTLGLEWLPPDVVAGVTLTGYRLYSAVKNGEPALLVSLSSDVLTYKATGYGTGVYWFWVSATYTDNTTNATGESQKTGPAEVEVSINSPKNLSIKSFSVE